MTNAQLKFLIGQSAPRQSQTKGVFFPSKFNSPKVVQIKHGLGLKKHRNKADLRTRFQKGKVTGI